MTSEEQIEELRVRLMKTGDALVVALDEKEQWQRQAFEMQAEAEKWKRRFLAQQPIPAP